MNAPPPEALLAVAVDAAPAAEEKEAPPHEALALLTVEVGAAPDAEQKEVPPLGVLAEVVEEVDDVPAPGERGERRRPPHLQRRR